jgi:hypothetical protein
LLLLLGVKLCSYLGLQLARDQWYCAWTDPFILMGGRRKRKKGHREREREREEKKTNFRRSA